MFSEMDNLNFQEFGNDSPFSNPNTDRRSPSSVNDTSNLVTGNIDLNDTPKTEQSKVGSNIFSFKFYQQYFDVDQDQVQNRLLRSLVPNLKSNFIIDHIQPIPDLYGPLWICITFVFSTAICGNLAHYIETHGQDRYENDFGLVTGATSLVTTYIIFVPFFLYWILWYRKSSIQYSYFELLSAYGYSLTVFILVSILWVIHFHWFRWILILVGISISCIMLFNIVWPAVKNDSNKMVALAIIGGVLLIHTGFALTFKVYYFDSVIPSKHGLVDTQYDIKPDIPKPEALIDKKNVSVEQKPPETENQVKQFKDDEKIDKLNANKAKENKDTVKRESTAAITEVQSTSNTVENINKKQKTKDDTKST